MKSKIVYLAFLINISVILLAYVSSAAIEIDMVRTKRNRREISRTTNQRLLADQDIVVQYQEGQDYFLVNLKLGTPAQVFPVQVDTSTSATWVPSTFSNLQNITKFDVNQSSTVRITNKTIEIDDEDGKVKGHATFDKVSIDNLTAPEFGFALVKEYEEEFTDYPQGKLGLGFRNPHNLEFSILEVLKKAGSISNKIFAISETNVTHGRLHIGDFPAEFNENSTKYSVCNATTTDGLEDEYRDGWVCELSHILIGGYNQNFTESLEVEGRVLFDSAYSYISIPDDYLNYFKVQLNKTGLDLNVCNKTIDEEGEISFICPSYVRNLKLVENAITLVLDGNGYQIALDDLFDDIDEQTCEFLLIFNTEPANVWNIGYPFLSQYFTVYNAEKGNIGFYGGDKVDFTREYTEYLNGDDIASKNARFFYMIVGAGILGAILLIVVIFLIVHSVKRRRLEEHGPLINERGF